MVRPGRDPGSTVFQGHSVQVHQEPGAGLPQRQDPVGEIRRPGQGRLPLLPGDGGQTKTKGIFESLLGVDRPVPLWLRSAAPSADSYLHRHNDPVWFILLGGGGHLHHRCADGEVKVQFSDHADPGLWCDQCPDRGVWVVNYPGGVYWGLHLAHVHGYLRPEVHALIDSQIK